MTDRVVMGALPGGGHGLRASRPGFNVLDPNLTPKQLAFDSRWPSAARLHMSGTFTANPQGSGTDYSSVGFGVDFGAIPPVMILKNFGNGWFSGESGGEFVSTSSGLSSQTRIYTSYMQFKHPYSGNGSPWYYRYVVLRPF